MRTNFKITDTGEEVEYEIRKGLSITFANIESPRAHLWITYKTKVCSFSLWLTLDEFNDLIELLGCSSYDTPRTDCPVRMVPGVQGPLTRRVEAQEDGDSVYVSDGILDGHGSYARTEKFDIMFKKSDLASMSDALQMELTSCAQVAEAVSDADPNYG